MTCADCGLTISEEEASASTLLADAYENIKATGLCIGCEFQRSIDERIRELKGEVECQTNED